MIKSKRIGINMQEDENAKAEILYAQGNYEEAVSAWEKAEEVLPHSFAKCYKKGIALRKLGRYDEAAATL
jgi:tetratricopeptide (TPR) repeat protein